MTPARKRRPGGKPAAQSLPGGLTPSPGRGRPALKLGALPSTTVNVGAGESLGKGLWAGEAVAIGAEARRDERG